MKKWKINLKNKMKIKSKEIRRTMIKKLSKKARSKINRMNIHLKFKKIGVRKNLR
jgi:hypothetical protein